MKIDQRSIKIYNIIINDEYRRPDRRFFQRGPRGELSEISENITCRSFPVIRVISY